MSILSIPQTRSVFDYYLKNKNSKKRLDQINTLDWCIRVLHSIENADVFEDEKIKLSLSFEYDIMKNEDRIKIFNYINCKIIHNNEDSYIEKSNNKNEEEEQQEESQDESFDNKNETDKLSAFLEYFTNEEEDESI